jgi:hypothetical protein
MMAAVSVGLLVLGCGGGGPDAGPEPQITVSLMSPQVPIYVADSMVLRWRTNLSSALSDVFVDGRAVATGFPGSEKTLTTSDLPEGPHSLEIRVARGANQATTGAIPFTVDHTPPTIESFSPKFLSLAVANRAPAVFRFSEPVMITGNASFFFVHPDVGTDPFGYVPGTIEVDADQLTYRFTPDGGWAQLEWPFPRRDVLWNLAPGTTIRDRAGNLLVDPGWSFYVTLWQFLGAHPAPAGEAWLDIVASPGGKLFMADRDPNFADELLEFDAGVFTAFPPVPAEDGGSIGWVSMAVQAEALHAASMTYFPGSRPPVLALHRWNDARWERVAAGTAGDFGESTLAMSSGGAAFVDARLGPQIEYGVFQVDGGTWEQLGANIPTTVETAGFPVRPMLTTDSTGTPWIALLESSASGKVAQVRRWSGAVWEAVGPPIGGLTPDELPRLAVDSAGRAVVSYRFEDPGTELVRIEVVRLENGAWVTLGDALRGRSGPPPDLEVGVFLRHAMTIRDGDRPVVAFMTGDTGAYGVELCEWSGSDWSCNDNISEFTQVYGPPAVTVWSGDAFVGMHAVDYLPDGGWAPLTGAIGPNR